VIIADTNLVSYLLIEGERTTAARRVHQQDPDWKLPTSWRSEFLNVLATAVRARVLERAQAFSVWWTACNLFSHQEIEPDGDQVLSVALERQISAYDAHFVVLAQELEVPLVTGDVAIARQCPDVAVTIEDFAA
jgi:predicted nucleic acid-binding protein